MLMSCKGREIVTCKFVLLAWENKHQDKQDKARGCLVLSNSISRQWSRHKESKEQAHTFFDDDDLSCFGCQASIPCSASAWSSSTSASATDVWEARKEGLKS